MDTVALPLGTSMAIQIHPTAIVDEGAPLASSLALDACMRWRKNGQGVSLGQNVFVGNKVTIGDRCKIQNNVSVYDNVNLQEGVCVGRIWCLPMFITLVL